MKLYTVICTFELNEQMQVLCSVAKNDEETERFVGQCRTIMDDKGGVNFSWNSCCNEIVVTQSDVIDSANGIAQRLIEQRGNEAPKVFLEVLPTLPYEASFIQLIVDALNEKLHWENEIIKCSECGVYSQWGNVKHTPAMWCCEECGKAFCNNCAPVDPMKGGMVLCTPCRADM